MKAFFVALQFLTRLPSPNYANIEPIVFGKSVIYFPIVGLITGLLLASFDYIFSFLPISVLAVLVLLLSILINGALHLDGLADGADAWLAGGDKNKSLEIMKDPHVGSAGAVSIVLILLFKYTLLLEIVGQGMWLLLLLIPIVSRTVPLAVMLTLPYARKDGIAQDMVKLLPRNATVICVILVIFFSIVFNYFALLTLAIGMLLLSRLMMNRLGGFTGDTLGASIEISEVLFIFGYIASLHLPL